MVLAVSTTTQLSSIISCSRQPSQHAVTAAAYRRQRPKATCCRVRCTACHAGVAPLAPCPLKWHNCTCGIGWAALSRSQVASRSITRRKSNSWRRRLLRGAAPAAAPASAASAAASPAAAASVAAGAGVAAAGAGTTAAALPSGGPCNRWSRSLPAASPAAGAPGTAQLGTASGCPAPAGSGCGAGYSSNGAAVPVVAPLRPSAV